MANDGTERNGATRRDYLKYGGAILGSGIVAGCTGESESQATETSTSTETATATETETETATEAAADGSYSVTMEPVGTVEFDSVPETWATYCQGYADMGIALGQADGLLSVGYKPRLHTHWYEELDGVSVDKESLQELYQGGIDKELFYTMDADIHVIDPNWIINNFKGWEQADVDEITEGVAPFIGNLIFRHTDTWHEDYQYYTMYEAFEKVAEIFQEQERYEAFKSLHDEYVRGRVAEQLPAESEAASAALIYAAGNEPEKFSPYRLNTGGTSIKHLRDLKVKDAFKDTDVKGISSTNRTKIDYEQLLEVDPDTLLLKGHETKTAAEFQDTLVKYMKNHDVGSQLTAVKNDRVFRGGPTYQGPIHNLFLVERTAKDLYPDTFSGELFDRQRVADIVTGDF
ncbi:ABC transporter substrate-binding protein [Halogeometricum borinquense]|uniref:ABC transporter substrate-binding protein n=1 Tax=Halogeometricum borinquense TaxID=60847 RepID=UPI00342A0BD4